MHTVWVQVPRQSHCGHVRTGLHRPARPSTTRRNLALAFAETYVPRHNVSDEVTVNPSREELVAEWLRCQADFLYYLSRYGKVREVVQVGRRKRKRATGFQMWDHVVEVARLFVSGEHVMLGKGRQLGASWLLVNYDAWRLTFFRDFNVLSISMGQRESSSLLDKVRYCLDRQPDWMRLSRLKDNESEIRLSNGASISALPSTKNAGRSETASLVQTDEFAFHEYAGENFSAYRPAVADGGQHLIVTTGNGPTGMFHSWWTQDTAEFDYHKVFWPWSVRPDRDEEWYERERAAFLAAGDKSVALFIRENPSTVEEMFTAVVGLVYESFSPSTHRVPPEVPYEDCQYRVAAVDPGQGDPFAILVVGANTYEEPDPSDPDRTTKMQRSHAYGPPFYEQGRVSAQQAYAYLKSWYLRAPLHAVLVDNPDATLIATLNAWFERDFGRRPVQMANKDRDVGFGLVSGRVRNGWFTFDPDQSMDVLQREFQTYRFREARAPGEADPYTTSTPVDHHGDLLDCLRYTLMWLAVYGMAKVRKGVTPPRREPEPEQPKMPKPDANGQWRDPRPHVRAVQSPRGPDYRVRRRHPVMGRR